MILSLGIRFLGCPVVAGALFAGWLCAVARAELVVRVESPQAVSLLSGATSTAADVYLQVTGVNPSLAGYQVRLDLVPAPGGGVTLNPPIRTFVSPPIRPALFDSSPADLGSTQSRILATDFLTDGAKIAADNDGLFRIPIAIQSNISGRFGLVLHAQETVLADGSGNSAPFSLVSGQLLVSADEIRVPANVERTFNYLQAGKLVLEGAASRATALSNGGPEGVVVLGGLDAAQGSVLDLNDNDLILSYSGNSPFPTVLESILNGLGAVPNTPQIASTHGRQQVPPGEFPITLHVPFDNAAFGATEWLGVSLAGANQIIAKYTYFGDLNLDGVVDAQDYLVIDNNFGKTTTAGPFGGDANLDGTVNSQDYLTIDNAFNFGGPGSPHPNPLAAPNVAPVPEPCTLLLGLISLAALGAALRTGRSSERAK